MPTRLYSHRTVTFFLGFAFGSFHILRFHFLSIWQHRRPNALSKVCHALTQQFTSFLWHFPCISLRVKGKATVAGVVIMAGKELIGTDPVAGM